MRYVYFATFLVVVLAVSVLGFRGDRFQRPPLEVFPDMDHQAHLKPQSTSAFFSDGRADRPLPAGVVPASLPLDNDDAFNRGKAADGSWLKTIPVAVDVKLLSRGQDRYQIYCAPCHGALGDGNGITKQYGMSTTPSYFDDRRMNLTTGEIFNVITHGATQNKNMLPYDDKLVPEDRWAVVAYVRALQRAQHGTLGDVPADKRKELGL